MTLTALTRVATLAAMISAGHRLQPLRRQTRPIRTIRIRRSYRRRLLPSLETQRDKAKTSSPAARASARKGSKLHWSAERPIYYPVIRAAIHRDCVSFVADRAALSKSRCRMIGVTRTPWVTIDTSTTLQTVTQMI